MNSKFDLYGLAKIDGLSEITSVSGTPGEQIVFEVLGNPEAIRVAHLRIMSGATSARLDSLQISLSGVQSKEVREGYSYTANSRTL